MDDSLNQVIVKVVNEALASGAVEKQVKESVTSLIESTVKDIFGHFGTVRKQLEEQIKKNLSVDLGQVDWVRYNTDLSLLVTRQVEGVLLESAKERMAATIKTLIGGPVPETVKLSEIAERFKAEARSNDPDIHDYTNIRLDLKESSYGYQHLYLYGTEDEKYSSRSVLQLMLNTREGGKLCLADFRAGYGLGATTRKVQIGILNDFEEWLFRLYANGTKVVIDDVETEYGEAD